MGTMKFMKFIPHCVSYLADSPIDTQIEEKRNVQTDLHTFHNKRKSTERLRVKIRFQETDCRMQMCLEMPQFTKHDALLLIHQLIILYHAHPGTLR